MIDTNETTNVGKPKPTGPLEKMVEDLGAEIDYLTQAVGRLLGENETLSAENERLRGEGGAHKFTGNGSGVIGADNCQICFKWREDHAEWETTPIVVK